MFRLHTLARASETFELQTMVDKENSDHIGQRRSMELPERIDPRLEEAIKKAQESKILMPIIKEELRLTILNRRLTRGQDDLPPPEKKQHIQRTLSPEEVVKKERRKEQNRRAARKCRNKKKCQETTVKEEYAREQVKQRELETEVTALRRQLTQLNKTLDDHAFCCRIGTPSPKVESPSPVQTHFPYSFGEPQGSTDLLDDCFQDSVFEPQPTCMDGKPQLSTPSCLYTGISPLSMLGIVDLPEEFVQFESGILEPTSPDQTLGRSSVSEYPHNDTFIFGEQL